MSNKKLTPTAKAAEEIEKQLINPDKENDAVFDFDEGIRCALAILRSKEIRDYEMECMIKLSDESVLFGNGAEQFNETFTQEGGSDVGNK